MDREKKHHRRIPPEQLAYRPQLEDLPAFHVANEQSAVDILELSKRIRLSASADFFEEIYAIIPVVWPTRTVSCIVYRTTVLLVEKEPFQIIKQLLETLEYLNFTIYKRTLERLLHAKQRLTPVGTKNFSLFPTGGALRADTCWINPGRIYALHTRHMDTIICLDNLFTVRNSRNKKSIRKNMEKAFLTHALMKREHDYNTPKLNISLLEYLGVTSSYETREVLKKFQFQHIPNYQHAFLKLYREVQQEQIIKETRRQLTKEWNIEY
ncbi:hypothetical protein IV487_10860 [Enterococcus saccharolyticus]|uniref:Uncharacterized protein n=1 Tax=Candidatus Enterococcus willemsii TaxID=1857215 RepID=A0ABQ6Z1I4_9ENTE|nr:MULTISPECIES: hypothetical protein [Enterococcus]KAF1305346.1 hypothetical protein BAU17_13265 [Enterococcus sp. CU12B]MCD5002962.1 hypothetical protein [Enterococcus saccharolyticus]